jgi:hypothetical protein
MKRKAAMPKSLVEARATDRPIPLINIVARPRDLKIWSLKVFRVQRS